MAHTKKIEEMHELVEKYDALKKQNPLDLSSDQDLSIAIMNLISIEEHLFFSGAKTKNHAFYSLIKEVRDMRKDLLKMIIREYEGEVWCISKHLLAGSMRLFEVGTKQLGMGKDAEATAFFEKAYDLYSLFWGLNMGLIGADQAADIEPKDEDSDEEVREKPVETIRMSAKDEIASDTGDSKKSGLLTRLGAMVKKSIDCCIE